MISTIVGTPLDIAATTWASDGGTEQGQGSADPGLVMVAIQDCHKVNSTTLYGIRDELPEKNIYALFQQMTEFESFMRFRESRVATNSMIVLAEPPGQQSGNCGSEYNRLVMGPLPCPLSKAAYLRAQPSRMACSICSQGELVGKQSDCQLLLRRGESRVHTGASGQRRRERDTRPGRGKFAICPVTLSEKLSGSRVEILTHGLEVYREVSSPLAQAV